jgi:hypothetical protein
MLPTQDVRESHALQAAPELPKGIRWRLTSRFTAASRKKRMARFLQIVQPKPTDRILDVGVTDSAWRSGNFLESQYPWPERITAVAPGAMPTFEHTFPDVRFVVADGRSLPFDDGSFEVGFSNAVIEHVGSRADQRRFIGEMVRTCRTVFIATPNGGFPLDPHTLLPFVHWLPRRIRHPLLRLTGNGRWASEAALNPLSAGTLRSLFPPGCEVRIDKQRVLGLTTVLVAIAGPSRSSGT